MDSLLSLRFYYKPSYGHKFATESAQNGHPVIDAETPIGVEISLGFELAKSLMDQIAAQWPDFSKRNSSVVE